MSVRYPWEEDETATWAASPLDFVGRTFGVRVMMHRWTLRRLAAAAALQAALAAAPLLEVGRAASVKIKWKIKCS